MQSSSRMISALYDQKKAFPKRASALSADAPFFVQDIVSAIGSGVAEESPQSKVNLRRVWLPEPLVRPELTALAKVLLQKEIGSPAHRLPHVFPDGPSLIARAFQTVSQLLEFTDGKAGRKQLCRTNVQLDDLKKQIFMLH